MRSNSTANCPQVRKAYRKRALQTHPDRLPQDVSAADKKAAEEQFRLVNNAYEVLNNTENRKVRILASASWTFADPSLHSCTTDMVSGPLQQNNPSSGGAPAGTHSVHSGTIPSPTTPSSAVDSDAHVVRSHSPILSSFSTPSLATSTPHSTTTPSLPTLRSSAPHSTIHSSVRRLALHHSARLRLVHRHSVEVIHSVARCSGGLRSPAC